MAKSKRQGHNAHQPPTKSRVAPAKKSLSHTGIQKEFYALQQQVGIKTSAAQINEIRRVKGQQATQAQFNRVRSELNWLLSQDILSDEDIEKINQKITYLEKLNPARWPRANDYRELLMIKQ